MASTTPTDLAAPEANSSTTGADAATPVIINPNPALQSYYQSLESRIGYRLVLGGTRHFGYYENPDTLWPFPISRRLRAMEQKLLEALDLQPGSRVIDAGCGVGHVALYMAEKGGLNVTAIDVVEHHLEKARRNVAKAEKKWRRQRSSASGQAGDAAANPAPAPGTVTVQRMDYHHLETLPASSHDGAYSIETLVHATDLEAVLSQFYRVLKPGGHVAIFEYEHHFATPEELADPKLAADLIAVNRYAAMPTNDVAVRGYFESKLSRVGFVDIQLRGDYGDNIRPMLRLFWLLAVVPLFFIRLLRAEKFFINTVAGARGYPGHKHWSYVAITARKPEAAEEVAATGSGSATKDKNGTPAEQ